MTVRSSSAEWHGNGEGGSGIVTVGDGVFSATDLAAGVTAPRCRPHEGPLRVLVGKERFSENRAWSEMPQHWPAGLAGRAVIEVVGQGQLEARLVAGGPPVDVVVPLWSPLPGRAIRAGGFGLIQQFGVGVDNVDLDAAAGEGVWVANMPGLNAVPVAEHAVALLLALARRLPEAREGVDDTVLRAVRPGAWLVNIARGALLDTDAAIAHLNTGHLAGLGLDVFPTEPYPADGPLAAHPRIVATAHTAALTSDYFAAASRRLGDALASYLHQQPPAGLLR
jgi:phosphoglycerate dehydrogenase-like enzyme